MRTFGQNIYAGHVLHLKGDKKFEKMKKTVRPILSAILLASLISLFCMNLFVKAKSAEEIKNCSLECEDTVKNQDGEVSIYLLTGIDNAGWNSDVIMLVSVSKALGKISVLQIPRDSYINIGGKNYHKINAVYSEGCRRAYNAGATDAEIYAAGSHALASFLEKAFGIKISGCAGVTTSGLAKIVDSIGGIDVNIPIDLSYDDNSQNLHIDLKAGFNHLNGDLAVKFVRCRKYANADYGRMSAQRMFMAAIFKKIKSEMSVKSLTQLFTSAYQNINTDIELSDALALARVGLKLDEKNIGMENIMGKSVKVGAVYCEVLNAQLTKEAIDRCLYFEKFAYLRDEFDPEGVFNNLKDENISKLYTDRAYFMK